jgi:hypothetical protein
MVACALAAIASSGSAGYFLAGWVDPEQGQANYTIFTWYCLYQLQGGEEPPLMWLNKYDTGVGWGDPTEMQLTRLPDEVTLYWSQSPLYYTRGYWGFNFWDQTHDEWSGPYFGPIVLP